MPNPVRPIQKFLLVVSLAVLTCATYWRALDCLFIYLDDNQYIFENPQVRNGLTWEGFLWSFTTFHSFNWHPVTWLSHMLDVSMFGLAPRGHHMVNVLLHAFSAGLLFLALEKMTKASWRSAMVAALFALHPLHVESVAWVAERKDVLSGLFFMLSLLGYARYVQRPRIGRYITVALLIILGLMAKPMMVTLPFLLLLLDVWPLGRTRFAAPADGTKRERTSFARLSLEKAPFMVLTVASCLVTYAAQKTGGAIGDLDLLPLSTRIANALTSYSGYIGKMFWPSPLAILYPHPEGSFSNGAVAGSAIFLVAASFLAVRGVRRSPYLIVGWLWFLGTLVPVIGLVQAGSQAMADRYTYIPLVGLFIMLVWGAGDLFPSWPFRRWAYGISAAVVLLSLGIATNIRIGDWKDSTTLFTQALEVTRNNWLIHYNLGVVLGNQGKIDEAMAHYREAIRIRPNYPDPHINLGVALGNQGRIDEAVANFREAVRIRPQSAEAHYNLGYLLEKRGLKDEAISNYREAIRIRPDFTNARINLGIALSR